MKNMKSFINTDNSKALVKILSKPALLDDLDQAELDSLYARFDACNPVSKMGKENRVAVLSLLEAKSTQPAQVNMDNAEVEIKSADIKNHEEIAKHIAENSAVLEIHISQPWFQRRIKSTQFLEESGNNAEIDPAVLHVVQDLINKKHTKAILMQRIRFTAYLKMMGVPGGILSLGNGQYLIPLKNIDKVIDKISEFLTERDQLIGKLEENYEEIKAEAREQRGVFFDEKDYPPFEEIRKQYALTYRFLSNAVPTELKKVNESIYNKEQARIKNELMDAVVEIRTALRESFKELVDHFAERLRPDEETGKAKVFHATRISKLKEFIETFNNRNLTQDDELVTLTNKANALLKGVSAADLRKDESIKSAMAASFEALKLETDKLIVNKGRAVQLD